MSVNEIIEKITAKPYVIDMGAKKIAKWFKADLNDVREAKRILREKGFLYKETTKTNPHSVPKILILDIETSPLLVFVYQKQVWRANIQHDKVVSDWFILTFSCKWLGDDTVISDKLTSTEAINEDDSRLVRKLWYILSDADIVIAHNGDNFDIPNINSRFVLNGLGPTTYYKQIDTLKVAQKQFGFTHSNLDALAKVFDIPAKIETTFELWKRCISGDSSALEEMELYNRHDVEILEQVYLRLRPWIKSHANLSLYTNSMEIECPHCGGKKLELIPDKYYYTHTGKWNEYSSLYHQSSGSNLKYFQAGYSEV